MKTPFFDPFLEVGVDYITATHRDRNSDSGLLAFGRWLVAEEVAQGSKRNTYRASGYRGNTAGRAAYGISHQGCIVRVGSGLAREHWNQCFTLAQNITRLDLQATISITEPPPLRIGTHQAELKRARRSRGKRARFNVRHGPTGAESCSLGNRLSDRYGRVYDKGLESGDEYFANTVRYELELHRKPALQTAIQLDQAKLDHPIILDHLRRFFCDRGLVVPEFSLADLERPLASVNACSQKIVRTARGGGLDIIRAARFMRHQVRPCVQRLVEGGRLDLVLESLGLTEHVKNLAHACPRNDLIEVT